MTQLRILPPEDIGEVSHRFRVYVSWSVYADLSGFNCLSCLWEWLCTFRPAYVYCSALIGCLYQEKLTPSKLQICTISGLGYALIRNFICIEDYNPLRGRISENAFLYGYLCHTKNTPTNSLWSAVPAMRSFLSRLGQSILNVYDAGQTVF